MSFPDAEMHESTAVPKTPEQIFVEGLVGEALDSYDILRLDPNLLVDTSKLRKRQLPIAEGQQNHYINWYLDQVTAIEFLGGVYDDPAQRVGELRPAYNNTSAVALFRVGRKQEAAQYLNDELDMKNAIPELTTLAGLGDDEAMAMLVSLVRKGGSADLMDTLATVMAISQNACTQPDIEQIASEIDGPNIKLGKRFNRQQVSYGHAIIYLNSFVMSGTEKPETVFTFLEELNSRATIADYYYGSEKQRVRMSELSAAVLTRFAEEYPSYDQHDLRRVVSAIGSENYDLVQSHAGLFKNDVQVFLELLPSNPYLYPRLMACFEDQDPVSKVELRVDMAIALAKAGKFTESTHYFKQLHPADKISVAHAVSSYYFDQGEAFEATRTQKGNKLDIAVAAALGHMGVGPGVDVARLPTVQFIPNKEVARTSAQILATLEVAKKGSVQGRYVDPSIEAVKKQALLGLRTPHERYAMLEIIRETEIQLAREHMCLEPALLPPFEEWLLLLEQGDVSWWTGISAQEPKK